MNGVRTMSVRWGGFNFFSLKSGVFLTLTVHLSLDWPYFKTSDYCIELI